MVRYFKSDNVYYAIVDSCAVAVSDGFICICDLKLDQAINELLEIDEIEFTMARSKTQIKINKALLNIL